MLSVVATWPVNTCGAGSGSKRAEGRKMVEEVVYAEAGVVAGGFGVAVSPKMVLAEACWAEEWRTVARVQMRIAMECIFCWTT